MKKLAIASVTALTLGLTGSAYAIGATDGFFFAGQAGVALQDLNTGSFSDSDETLNASLSQFSWGVDAGYNFMMAPNWLLGLDLGFSGLGDYKISDSSGDSGKLTFYSVNFLGNITYVYNNFHIWAETGVGIGINNATADQNYGGDMGAVSQTQNQTKAVYILGAGAGYQWEQLDFFVRYDHYFGDSKTSEDFKFPKIDAIYGGIAYTF